MGFVKKKVELIVYTREEGDLFRGNSVKANLARRILPAVSKITDTRTVSLM